MVVRLKIGIFYTVIAACLIIAFGGFSSCTKPDTEPQLELTVVDVEGQPVVNVFVGLFDDLDEWSMHENPIQAWRETDKNGKVLFVDLQEIVYYFYADGDSICNVGHEINLTEALMVNERRQITVIIE